ncbi:nucleolar and coiled-body phosphoprotein 1 isoform X3 [Penaeus vannamei]|uniref:nucleolar and coiled-body phosphoprotein 1 isoform X3 n=1 Tax=Penaeus vannamei TaxID=6689 RepID=UPI00387F3D0B
MDLSVSRRGDEEEEEGSQPSAVNNGSLTSDEAMEEEESTEAAQPTPAEEAPGENSNSNAVMDLSGNVPASNKRLREGEEDSEVSGECEAPPTSRPRLTEASETNNTANHINDNHQPAIDLTDDAPKVNGISNGYESDSNGVNEDDEMPPVPPIKELSPEELAEKMKLVRRLQIMKENVSATANDAKAALTKLPSNTTATKLPPTQPPPLIKHELGPKASSSAIPAHIKVSRDYKQQVKNLASQASAESLSPTALQAQKHLLARGKGTTLTSTAGSNGSSSNKSGSGGNSGSSSNLISGLPANLNLPFNLSREVEIIRKDSPASSSSPGPGPRDSPSQVSISKVRTSTPHISHPSADRVLIKVRTSPLMPPLSQACSSNAFFNFLLLFNIF